MSNSVELTIKTPLESFEFHYGSRAIATALDVPENLVRSYTDHEALEALQKISDVRPHAIRSRFLNDLIEEIKNLGIIEAYQQDKYPQTYISVSVRHCS